MRQCKSYRNGLQDYDRANWTLYCIDGKICRTEHQKGSGSTMIGQRTQRRRTRNRKQRETARYGAPTSGPSETTDTRTAMGRRENRTADRVDM